jgi:hypothetical protein
MLKEANWDPRKRELTISPKFFKGHITSTLAFMTVEGEGADAKTRSGTLRINGNSGDLSVTREDAKEEVTPQFDKPVDEKTPAKAADAPTPVGEPIALPLNPPASNKVE